MYAKINGTKIFFDVEGTGWLKSGGKLVEKPVCFVLHGGPGGTHLGFRPVLTPFSETMQLVYIDNRGSGLSSRGPQSTYTLEQNVDDIEALRKYLGLKKIFILGHSYGGMTAMSYALKYHENLKGLMLLATSASYRFLEKAKAFIKEKGTNAQKEAAKLLWEGNIQSQEQLSHYYEVMAPLYSRKQIVEQSNAVQLGNRSYEALNEGFGKFLRTYDIVDELDSIRVPTLVMAGRYDWITSVEESQVIADKITNSKLIIFENSSHNVLVDETDLFLSVLNEFVNEIKEGKYVSEKRNLKGFEGHVKKVVEDHQIPGTSVAIAREGEIEYFKGFGFRNINEALPVTEETVFGIGSVTKSFTCVAIMQLQESGKLNVNDPVIKYLPEFRLKNEAALKQITIHHFMTHSSGLPPMSTLIYAMKRSLDLDSSKNNYPGLKIEEKAVEPIDTYEQLMEFISNQEFDLLGAPGTQFSYSNDAYALLGAIIERVSGKSYEQFIYDNILMPCRMNNSFFTIDEYGDYDNITACYAEETKDGKKRVFSAPIWWDTTSMRAAGFLKSTASDMLKYAEIFRNGGVVNDKRILSEDSVASMLTPHIKMQPGRYYGYGFMITPDYFGTLLVEHGGSLKAVAAQLNILPEKGISGVVLANLAGVPSSRIMQYAFNGYEGREIEDSHISFEEYSITTEVLEQYVGDYQSNEGMQVKIDIRNGKPILITQELECPIKFVDENIFIANINDSTEIAEILKDENGKTTGISYHFRQFPKVETKQTV